MRMFMIIMAVCFAVCCAQAQLLSFDHGKVEFHTSSIMSDIEAVSKEMDVSLDVETGEVNIRIPISSFDFEYEMMQDHFNEDYLESELYPYASFQGKITQDITPLQEVVEVDVSGNLIIHGVTKMIKVTANISQTDGFTRVKCVFPIVFKDFNVDEPSILSKSVAKDVELKAILYLK